MDPKDVAAGIFQAYKFYVGEDLCLVGYARGLIEVKKEGVVCVT